MADLFKPVATGLSVAVRVTPNAGQTRIDGLGADADGHSFLKIGVTAAPEDGKANAAAIKLLAKDLRLPKSALTIASGATNRRKTIVIAGDARELEAKLTARLADWLKRRDAA